MDININILLVCLFVCLLLSVSKKNVKTAEPICCCKSTQRNDYARSNKTFLENEENC